MMARKIPLFISAILCSCAAGCVKEDADHLAGVGRKVLAKTEPMLAPLQDSWKQHVHAAGPSAEPGLEERVSLRLRWESSLSELSIQVVASEGGVELRGKVSDPEQKKRAVEVAKSTTGVSEVVDALDVEAAAP